MKSDKRSNTDVRYTLRQLTLFCMTWAQKMEDPDAEATICAYLSDLSIATQNNEIKELEEYTEEELNEKSKDLQQTIDKLKTKLKIEPETRS